MGFLSRFDTKLSDDILGGGIKELDPGRSDLGKALAIGDPIGLPILGVASGNLGPFGTPTESGVDNPLAVSGITDVAHDKGAEIAALTALGSWIGGGASGLFSGGGTGAEAGGAVGYDPGASGMYVGDAAGAGAGASDAAYLGSEDPTLLALADTGTTTDVTPGVLVDSGPTAAESPEIGAGTTYPGETTQSGPAGTTVTSPPSSTNSNLGSGLGKTASKYGVPLALLGASSLLSSRKQEMPNKAQYAELSAEAQAMARTLLEQYKNGTLSPAQQAQLDQLTQQQKNQINNYYASIGQAGSTSHQQALAKADMDGLALKANMLQTSLNQGLQAIGIAVGPLNAMANYQMQQDKRLQDAYANFARSAAYLYGMNSTPQGGQQQAAA